MTSPDDKRFESLVRHYNGEQLDPIEGAAAHPLMVKASRYIIWGELSDQIDDADYIEILALLRHEFDLSPNEVSTAMEICEERVAREQT